MITAISIILIWCQLARGSVEMEEKAEVGGAGSSGRSAAGNTSFVEGVSWCVAHPGAAQADVQSALDWACGMGRADCTPIRAATGRCFHPNTLLAHASFAFNNYYQQNGNSHIACNFGGTAFITRNDPSYDGCVYESSASGLSKSSASTPSSTNLWKRVCWTLASVLVLFNFHPPFWAMMSKEGKLRQAKVVTAFV